MVPCVPDQADLRFSPSTSQGQGCVRGQPERGALQPRGDGFGFGQGDGRELAPAPGNLGREQPSGDEQTQAMQRMQQEMVQEVQLVAGKATAPRWRKPEPRSSTACPRTRTRRAFSLSQERNGIHAGPDGCFYTPYTIPLSLLEYGAVIKMAHQVTGVEKEVVQ